MRVKIDKEVSLELLKKLEGLGLEKYYNFDEEEFLQNSLKGIDELKRLLEEPKILTYDPDQETFKYQDDDGEWKNIEDFKGINNFDQTDEEISERLFDIGTIFSNSEVGDISKEMECFYLTINIAAVFGGRFKKNFLKTVESYDFDNWKGSLDALQEERNFDKLYKNFQKVSTMKMRMLSSACSYKLKKKKNEPFSFQTRGLPQDVVSSLGNTQNEIKQIRLKYETGKLSPDSRRKLKKFEILQRVDEMNSEISQEVQKLEEKNLLELWKIFKINAEYIDEETSQEILDSAQELLEESLQEGRNVFSETEKASIDYLKRFRSTCERKCKNAVILKMKEEELDKWLQQREKYRCPSKK